MVVVQRQAVAWCAEGLTEERVLFCVLFCVLCDRLDVSQCFTLGDVTTVNMTMVKGGVAYNVIPAEMEVSFDLRIPPTVNLQVGIIIKNYYFIASLSISIFPGKCVHISSTIWSKVV